MERPDGDYKGWEPDRGRWTRMHKGVRFRRTPEQLGLPKADWTAERSHTAWLAWLREAINHFELTGEVPPPPKKEKQKKKRASEGKFVPWRDDPDYPKDEFLGNRGLDQLREYSKMSNELHREEARILDDLRDESRTENEYREYLRLRGVVCGNGLTLEDRRYAIKKAHEVLDYAKKLNELRQYAKTMNQIHDLLRALVGLRSTVEATDDYRQFGETLNDLHEFARIKRGSVPPPSYRGWEGPPRYRWSRMYKGIRYRVTCEELGLPKDRWTAAGSHEAWLKWFELAKVIEDLDVP